LATAGCWDEIRYTPSKEPDVKPVSEPVVLRSETPREELAAPPPSSKDLFAEDQGGETASVAPTVVEAPPPPIEIQTPVPEVAPDAETALAAWRLGSKWSLAVAIVGKGYGEDRYGSVWDEARREAELLDVALPPLPQGMSAEDLVATASSVSLDSSGPELAAELGSRYTAQHEALCDLAIKTHAILLTYSPENREVKSLVAAIRLSAENSGLPEDLWQPLVELLDARAEFSEVKRAVFQLHRDAQDYLTQQAQR
jgi:hypothetical protein